MTIKDPYEILGISPGATEGQIKSAYRKMARKFHPDLNPSAGAQEKFHEINKAYESLLEHPLGAADRASSYDDTVAREVYRRERERMHRQARARREKKKREDEFFNQPRWHDPILLIRYLIHALGIVIATAAIVGPILLAILKDPASLAGTFFFLLAGVVIWIYIYQKRKSWFRLGKFKTRWSDVTDYLSMGKEKKSGDRCCYSSKAMAGGKPYRIELLKTVDVKIRSYGALNHEAKFKNQVKRVLVPRSVRAHFIHRITSLLKLGSVLGCLFLFPVESLLWRFLAGIVAGGLLSSVLLVMSGIRSKVSYLFTPGLLFKSGIWILCLALISEVGPGFNIQISGYVYLMVAGLLFLLDMAFDLIMGFLPFYRWFFRPIVRQGKVLEGLYRDGYQNYQELPVYSVLYPLYRWLF